MSPASASGPLPTALLLLLLLLGVADAGIAMHHEKRLFLHLTNASRYNPIVRPVKHSHQTVTTFLGLRLLQIIDVDEKNQIMTTNVWLHQEWTDCFLTWDPREFGGIRHIQLPIDNVWKPELVLYNNADENYEIRLKTKATVWHGGRVVWKPASVFRSMCPMNVEFFPFDEQTCPMKFGSWTYEVSQVNVIPIQQRGGGGGGDAAEAAEAEQQQQQQQHAIDLTDFRPNVAWHLMAVPGSRHVNDYRCCPSRYADVTFYITVRRRALFYTANLIIPCVGISFLAVLTFYLPSGSCEKISLSISIMLSLSVFILLLSELMPTTSITVPVVGKYLLFTVILGTLTIVATVVVLNVHFRSPLTNQMHPWVRIVFIRALPRLLLMTRPKRVYLKPFTLITESSMKDRFELILNDLGNTPHQSIKSTDIGVLAQVSRTVSELAKVAQQLKNEDEVQKVKDDWKYVALVIDRLFLWIFTTASIIGAVGIICQAPNLYDYRQPLQATK